MDRKIGENEEDKREDKIGKRDKQKKGEKERDEKK